MTAEALREHPARDITVRAHAKINLILRILAREVGGYHGIETLFQRLALHDVITVRRTAETRTLHCDGPAMPDGGLGPVEHNLAWRAADLYAREAAWEGGWDIVITKQIPVGGGLGGGSADAAAVLRAMDALSPAPVGVERLLQLGGTLGADVPFMVLDTSRAWGWSRGDRLLVLPPLPVVPVLLCTFRDGVNTGDAYRAFAARREGGHGDSVVPPQAVQTQAVPAHAYTLHSLDDWNSVATLAANDFEQVVPALHAGVADVLPTLRQFASSIGAGCIGMLSGSGATCFLITPPDTMMIPPQHWSVILTETA